MSTIVCLKEKHQLILGTDSRFLKHDFSGVHSDTEQKIHEIAPNTFIATSGWKLVCEFQETRARQLVGKLGTPDIRVLGEALKRETVPHVMALAEALSPRQDLHEQISKALSGEAMIHGCVLAGRTADRRLGYVKQAYRMRAGQVVVEADEYFGDERQIFISAGDPARDVAKDPIIWTGRPAWVVRRILAALKRACPVIGGPDQIVCLDRSGTHWISQPPVEVQVG